MQLTESDHFLRDEGPFVSWPPSLLEDLLEEVHLSSHCFVSFTKFNFFNEKLLVMFRCADNDALPFIFTFLFRFLNLIYNHWREETKR